MEPYLSTPQIFAPADPYYADDSRRFQGIPAVERASEGRLWAAWYGGGITEDRFNYVLLATSSDNGDTWSSPALVIDPDRSGPVRAFDPCLWHDPTGRLWLFWAQGYEKHTDEQSGVWAIITDNSESGKPIWSEPRRLCDGIMMNKPISVSTGDWLLPVAEWHRDVSARVYASGDEGGSWVYRGGASIPNGKDRSADEHMIVELDDGRLWMLVRTGYGIGETVSTDYGESWSEVTPSRIAHPTSRFFVKRLASGAILLVKHGPLDERTDRSDLTAYVSKDDGVSWTGGLVIDHRTGVSYPDGVEAPDGTIFLVYDFDRKGEKEILLTHFRESDVAAETEASLQTRRRTINKATGHTVNHI